jgi:hypothetical protein
MLRKSPLRTPALLAANRRNARKSTGPRTVRGRARVALNALKHGRYTRHLHQRLLRAGESDLAALYRGLRMVVFHVFVPLDVIQYRDCERMAAEVWCHLTPPLEGPGTKPECPLQSEPIPLRLPKALGWLAALLGPDWQASAAAGNGGRQRGQRRARAAIRSSDRRMGVTFWVQHRRFWTPDRVQSILLAEDDKPDGWVPDRPPGTEWESNPRFIIYRVAQPKNEETEQPVPVGPEQRRSRLARWVRAIVARFHSLGRRSSPAST